MTWLVYGANGYTGKLIARAAVQRGMRPLLGGRSADKLGPLARELGLETRVFPLDDAHAVARALTGVSLVLHCAGPFSATAAPMLQACLRAGAHYLDISGEISSFEYAHARHLEAEARGVVVCPGVGFDVVPTDCLAAKLKKALPEAVELALGFDSRSGLSPGTAKTMVENLPLGGCVRKDGQLLEVPHMYHTRRIDFGDGEKLAGTIPWGDVATAYYTTGIPNIEVYVPVSKGVASVAKLSPLLRFVTAPSLVQSALKARIDRSVSGPDEETRRTHPTFVWGEARDAAGRTRTGRVRTQNGYSVTVEASLKVVEWLIHGHAKGGYFTPSQLMGADFVAQLPESSAIALD